MQSLLNMRTKANSDFKVFKYFFNVTKILYQTLFRCKCENVLASLAHHM